MCVCVCVCVILEHEDKNVKAELIWRVLIAIIKTPIHISQSKFSFQSLKHSIIYMLGLETYSYSLLSPEACGFRVWIVAR